MKVKLLLIFIIIASWLFFFPALTNFFNADDWFHLRISSVNSVAETVDFFSFTKNPHTASFYRPIPTQLFFGVFYNLFGLNDFPYHLFVFLNFSLSLFLIFKLAEIIYRNHKISLLSAFIYGFSVTNFTRLYFLSAFQEIAMVNFVLLSLISYLNNSKYTALLTSFFYILALSSKETAIVTPVLILMLGIYCKKGNLIKILSPITVISLAYLYLRFVNYGLPAGDSYSWNYSPLRAINTLMWYLFWSLGAPENLLNFVGKGLKISSNYFLIYPVFGYTTIAFGLSSLLVIFLMIIRVIKVEISKVILWGLFYCVSLGPVIFLPDHKFALELALPMVGLSILFSLLILKNSRLGYIFIFFYLILNVVSNQITYFSHYVVSRAMIARRVYSLIINNYKIEPPKSYFLFTNSIPGYSNTEWSESHQVALALSRSDFFAVVYKDPSYKVYYEDKPNPLPTGFTRITINSKLFLE